MLQSSWSSNTYQFLHVLRKRHFHHYHHHSSHESVNQLQYRELEDVSSRGLSPLEGWSQEHTTNEETVIEAKTDTCSSSWTPIIQMVPAVDTPPQQAQHRANPQLSLGLPPYPQVHTTRKPKRLLPPFPNSLCVTLLYFISSRFNTQQLFPSGSASGTGLVSVQLTGPSRWE